MKSSVHLLIAFLVITAIGMQACKKSGSDTPALSYTVTLSYPDNYAETKASNATVTLTNSTTNVKSTATTNAEGVATFTGILPGNYQLSAAKTLDAATALALTGFDTEVFLNAAATNQLISADGGASLQLQGSKVGGLVFKQIFYTGTKTPANGNYSADQFYEIYNNSTDVIYADSLYLGESGGTPGISSASIPFAFSRTAGNVYVQNVWMIPGTGKTYPVQPGASIIISSNAINHKTDAGGNANSVDLGAGISDFEGYVSSTGRDVDNPAVTNLELTYYGLSTNNWLATVFGPSMVIFRTKDINALPKLAEPGSTNPRLYIEVPGADVIDAVDCLANANAVNFKRFPSALDAGFMYCSASYVGESVIRKVRSTVNGRKILQDTNNSSSDFTVSTTPLPKGWR